MGNMGNIHVGTTEKTTECFGHEKALKFIAKIKNIRRVIRDDTKMKIQCNMSLDLVHVAIALPRFPFPVVHGIGSPNLYTNSKANFLSTKEL
jgi:hypothetical protein